jgi:hypothetical protein
MNYYIVIKGGSLQKIFFGKGCDNYTNYSMIAKEDIQANIKKGFPVILHEYTYTEALEKIYDLYMNGITGKK